MMNTNIGRANKIEFLQAEEIINQVIQEIDCNWSIKQKLAYIHYKMGDLVSYVPDFDNRNGVNMPEATDARNIWKSLIKGESVCNGITSIQRTILSRLGIKTRALSSGTHTFMLTETEEGNIITDATWDLSSTLYKARPMYFGITYEQLIQQEEGLSNAHRLKEPPENVIEISDEELREIYHSIGLTAEDRKFFFPAMHLAEEIESQKFDSIEQKINAFLEQFISRFGREAAHLQETRSILEDIISDFGIKRDDIQSGFVYSKDDEDCKTPYLIMGFKNNQMKGKVKFLDLEQMQFTDMEMRQLDSEYRTHFYNDIEPFWKIYLQGQDKAQEVGDEQFGDKEQ